MRSGSRESFTFVPVTRWISSDGKFFLSVLVVAAPRWRFTLLKTGKSSVLACMSRSLRVRIPGAFQSALTAAALGGGEGSSAVSRDKDS